MIKNKKIPFRIQNENKIYPLTTTATTVTKLNRGYESHLRHILNVHKK